MNTQVILPVAHLDTSPFPYFLSLNGVSKTWGYHQCTSIFTISIRSCLISLQQPNWSHWVNCRAHQVRSDRHTFIHLYYRMELQLECDWLQEQIAGLQQAPSSSPSELWGTIVVWLYTYSVQDPFPAEDTPPWIPHDLSPVDLTPPWIPHNPFPVEDTPP